MISSGVGDGVADSLPRVPRGPSDPNPTTRGETP